MAWNPSRRVQACAIALLLCSAAATPLVHAGCSLPSAPSRFPDGATASDDEMRVVMLAMSHFETDVNNYVKCLEFEAGQGRIEAPERDRLRAQALDRHQTVVARFNAQMRIYMAR